MAAISVRGLTKRFGGVTAVNDLSFDVESGTITGFLGPNGAGKTTTLRMILGLVHPTAGSALVDGAPYGQLDRPAFTVGAALEATGFHPGRTARNHLRILAHPNQIPTRRVDEVLEEVDLASAARRRVGGFSLGMRQRLMLAGALLGDPGILVLDEPTNGLDPAGVHWLREFLGARVDGGGTVLVSSHLLAELAMSADAVVIIKEGRLVTRGHRCRTCRSYRILGAGADAAGAASCTPCLPRAASALSSARPARSSRATSVPSRSARRSQLRA